MMKLFALCYLSVLICYANAISDEEFQTFKTEISTHVVALENQVNDGLGQIQGLTLEVETVSNQLNESENEIRDLKKQVKRLELLTKLIGPETCLEMANAGIEESMNVMLDPDGKNQGLSPIKVKCQIPEGKTILGQEVIAVVDTCDTKGCYKKDLVYDAPMGQIEALMTKSSTCSQSIKIECTSAPIVDLVSSRHTRTVVNFLKNVPKI